MIKTLGGLARHATYRSAVGLTVILILRIDVATVEAQVVDPAARTDSRRPVIAAVTRIVDLPVFVIAEAGKTKV